MKQWFSFYFPKYGDLYEILDAAKVSDLLHVWQDLIVIVRFPTLYCT
jgi:hypothetical protein